MFPRFWESLSHYGKSVALIDDNGTSMTYSELATAVDQAAARISSKQKRLVLLEVRNDLSSILTYLSVLRCGHAVILQPQLQGCAAEWSFPVQAYSPDLIICSPQRAATLSSSDYTASEPLFGQDVLRLRNHATPISDEIGLLISTSGSTGSPKLACISWNNLAASASQICKALNIGPDQRAISSLPISFVYGLTTIHSHFAVGASVLITQRSILDREFWSMASTYKVCTLAGVPWTYQTLRKTRFCRSVCPSLRNFTQSGGKLDSDTYNWMVSELADHECDVYFMYGQTEATGRISVLPPAHIRSKLGSVGIPVDHGHFFCNDSGEIVYTGPNMMIGYSNERYDLSSLKPINMLHTGDLGYIDNEGFLYLTGRISRICKLVGVRWNLDEMEFRLNGIQPVAVKSNDTNLDIYAEGNIKQALLDMIERLLSNSRFPPGIVRIFSISSLPRSARGKILYGSLTPERMRFFCPSLSGLDS